MTKLLGRRFVELESQLDGLEASKRSVSSALTGAASTHIDENLLLNWKVKAKTLLISACGESSQHMTSFLYAERTNQFTTNYEVMKRLRAVFLAAKDDFEGGYLNSVRNLVHAEVFGSELEQAEELLTSGYASAAAVIAGVVLETTVRNLCTDRDIPHGKLDRMNADLSKAGAYNLIQQKRITAIAAIRNAAAHGDADKFNPGDVRGMIDDIERFLSTHLQ